MRLPDSVSMKCPCCGKPLDIQGIERTNWHIFDCWCHDCVAHVTIRLKATKPAGPATEK